jgi:hypothetical protein
LDDLRDIENIIGSKNRKGKKEMEVNAELEDKKF